jgi:isocitrate/isopropylmalate dehydrogenase
MCIAVVHKTSPDMGGKATTADVGKAVADALEA